VACYEDELYLKLLYRMRVEQIQPDSKSVPQFTERKSKVKYITVHAINAYRGTELQRHSFLISALDAGVWSTSHPGCFTLGERAFVSHSTHRIRGWVGPTAGQDI